MAATVRALPTLEELRNHVHKTLCEHDVLEPSDAPLFQARITRRGRCCGLFFQVNGPRSVKVYALWAGDDSRILFYDSTGTRFAETRLSDAPDPASVAEEAPTQKAA